jgi:hypothetical protein
MERRSGRSAANGFTVLTVAALLAATGCGGSGTPRKTDSAAGRTEGTQPAGSNQAAANSRLIASADPICRRVNGQLTGASHPQPADIARTAPRNAAIELRAVGELSKLTPPASLARDWTQMLAYRRTLAQELFALARDAKAGDVAGMRALGVSKKRVRQKLSQLAARDGFKDCTSVGTVSIAALFPTLRPAAAPAQPGG